MCVCAVEQVRQVLQQTPFESPAADVSAAAVMPELEKDDRMLEDKSIAVFTSLLVEAEQLVATNSLVTSCSLLMFLCWHQLLLTLVVQYPFVASPDFVDFDKRRCQAIQRDIELLAEITHAS
ncbi:MAG: hypothetical protein MHM6MM_009184 [Cercozoa sp. M6MM]